MEQKYGALRILSSVNAFVGYAILIVGGISSIIVIFSSKGGFLVGLPLLIACVFLGVVLIAFGELINVFIDIESNTRYAARQNSEFSSTMNTSFEIKTRAKNNNDNSVNASYPSSEISKDEELISNNAISKLEKNGYAMVLFNPNSIKWTLKSNSSGESFELSLKELIDLANNF